PHPPERPHGLRRRRAQLRLPPRPHPGRARQALAVPLRRGLERPDQEVRGLRLLRRPHGRRVLRALHPRPRRRKPRGHLYQLRSQGLSALPGAERPPERPPAFRLAVGAAGGHNCAPVPPMKLQRSLLALLLLAPSAGCFGDDAEVSETQAPATEAPPAPEPLAVLTPVEVNMDKVRLGRDLFHDTRLSGDGTVACVTCHSLDHGGAEPRKTSIGIREQVGPINAPTVL